MQRRRRSCSSCEELLWPQMRTSSCLPGACSTASKPGAGSRERCMVNRSLVLAWLQGQKCTYASHRKLPAL